MNKLLFLTALAFGLHAEYTCYHVNDADDLLLLIAHIKSEKIAQEYLDPYSPEVIKNLENEIQGCTNIAQIENDLKEVLERRKDTLKNCPAESRPICKRVIAFYEAVASIGLARKFELERELIAAQELPTVDQVVSE